MTATSTAAQRVCAQMETLWNFAYAPAEHELASLYRISKKNQWDAAAVIDWNQPIGQDGPILDVAQVYAGAAFVERLSAQEARELEVRVSAWRLSQFLHGEQAALLICGQLIGLIPDLDGKQFAAAQAMDEARHLEAFERYVKRIHRVYPPDPLLKRIADYILGSSNYEVKLVGMQIILEGTALASFNLMRRQTGDPALQQLLAYILQDEGRHMNFGLLMVKKALAGMSAPARAVLEDFAWMACDGLYGGGVGGFRSVDAVWREMGWEPKAISHDIGLHAPAVKTFNGQVFVDMLVPKLTYAGLISERVRPLYERSGLLGPAPARASA